MDGEGWVGGDDEDGDDCPDENIGEEGWSVGALVLGVGGGAKVISDNEFGSVEDSFIEELLGDEEGGDEFEGFGEEVSKEWLKIEHGGFCEGYTKGECGGASGWWTFSFRFTGIFLFGICFFYSSGMFWLVSF